MDNCKSLLVAYPQASLELPFNHSLESQSLSFARFIGSRRQNSFSCDRYSYIPNFNLEVFQCSDFADIVLPLQIHS